MGHGSANHLRTSEYKYWSWTSKLAHVRATSLDSVQTFLGVKHTDPNFFLGKEEKSWTTHSYFSGDFCGNGLCLGCLSPLPRTQDTLDVYKQLRAKTEVWTRTQIWDTLNIYGWVNLWRSSPVWGHFAKTGRCGCFVFCVNTDTESKKMKKQENIFQRNKINIQNWLL